MAEYVVNGAEPNETVLHSRTPNGYEEWSWLPVRERIVRCRDCAQTAPYGDGIECHGPLVETWDYFNDQPLHNPVQPDGFCAWGERRESE